MHTWTANCSSRCDNRGRDRTRVAVGHSSRFGRRRVRPAERAQVAKHS